MREIGYCSIDMHRKFCEKNRSPNVSGSNLGVLLFQIISTFRSIQLGIVQIFLNDYDYSHNQKTTVTMFFILKKKSIDGVREMAQWVKCLPHV